MNRSIKVLSFNIRYDNPKDGFNSWEHRRQMVFDIIRKSGADFIGIQEAVIHQVHQIEAEFPELGCVSRSREVSTDWGEGCPIFYRRSKWEVKEFGTFWHSKDIYSPGSKSWNNPLPRITTWIHFRSREDDSQIVVYNTHLDYESILCRDNSVKLMIEHWQNHHKNLPLIITGDFNSHEDNQCILEMKSHFTDTYRKIKSDDGNSFHGWSRRAYERIDYIFCTKQFNVDDSFLITECPQGRYPSDHYPLATVLSY